ncbi:C5-sterol desaturase [Vararia minispora EC-137]|uniref:C5-sterol desaturase n=1 Tax=Vararia minispora EC-137 TaxID=1314806 RepID=A0ACB8QLJ8_9AGAM|nr:C5-sterol desaturase [Vararia minispora EC-137]
MDLVLNICDDLFLDALYSKVVPLTAFAHEINGTLTSAAPVLLPALQKWHSLVAYLPHPPLTGLSNGSSATFSSSQPTLSAWPRDYIPRQLISLSVITLIGVHIVYFLFSTLSYYLIFNHDMMRHPRFLKNQVWLEIKTSLAAFPVMTLLTLPWFEAEVLGWSKLYDDPAEYGYLYLAFSALLFLVFTDYAIYWIHRLEHHPSVYKYVHKPHHKWLVPTPFASFAFHPVDGYLQSLPYHIFIFLFPLHRWLYLGLFVFVQLWTILIHDSDMITGHPLEKVINGPAHHTLHHLYFTVNYGQYFTWADRWGGSYRQPSKELDPLLEVDKLKHD